MVWPHKFHGSTPWAVFQLQFETVAEHKDWVPLKKATHLIATLNEPAAHILHVVPTGAMYREVTEVLASHCSYHHFEEVFHPWLKRRI
jgi:hypothetical protein